jgi:hypothetical protein
MADGTTHLNPAQAARRALKITAAAFCALALAGCANSSLDFHDDSGLEPPPFGSIIPEPHTGAFAPSETISRSKQPDPPAPAAGDYPPAAPRF